MSLIFPYSTFPTPKPIWSLNNRLVRPRPMIIVAILGPAGTVVDKALLDTGADDSVFPDVVAGRIGIDLSNAPTGVAAGIGLSAAATVRYAECTLRISDGREYREWLARVGFTSAPIHRPLLGFAGFMQYFTATFHGDRESVELAVNATYAGK
jgi:hypothetical protein